MCILRDFIQRGDPPAMLKDMYSEVKYSFEHTHCNGMYMRLFVIERQKQEAESDISVVESDVKSILS